jgi:FkbH-like protein
MAIYPKDLMKVVLDHFDLSGDFTKTQQYKENYQRAKAQEQFSDINDYLASLDMVLTIKLNDTSQIARISELTQKTNQFNLTTNRHVEDQIQRLMEESKVYSLSVKDKFGDNGLTGVCVIVDWDVPQYGIIAVFLLSCRILGRGIEFAFMDYIIQDIKKAGYTHIYGEYIPSQKNHQVENLYPSIGFERCNGAKDENVYYMDINKYKPIAQKHFRYE